MQYKLWDIEAGSYIGNYTDERDALAIVKTLVDRYGDEYAESLSMGRVADDGRILAPLSGYDLCVRAYGGRTNDEERRPKVIASTIGRVPEGLGMAAKAGSRAVRKMAMNKVGPMAPRRDKGTWNKKSN